MKRSLQAKKTLLGVTLLEIMLVLAIASMVIVMSIRYYQSASNNQKINAALNVITGMVAGGESVLGATGSLATVGTAIKPYLPNNKLPDSPWGGVVEVTAAGESTYRFTVNVPAAVCPGLLALVNQNSKLSTSNCGTPGKITVIVVE